MIKSFKIKQLLPFLLLLIGILLVAYLYPLQGSEIAEMGKTANTAEKVSLYRKLIERVGPEQAQEDLLHSGLPFTGETHLINHLSGDYLYKQKGIAGILGCKDYFLSSCYHGLLLNAIANEGLESLSKVMSICYEKGPAVSSQCSHAVGHGLLAWVGYKKLPEALEHCEALKQKDNSFPLFNCEDGVFMENLWAVHDDGMPSPDRWIKESDPLYPCSDPRVKPEWQNACWSNQPSVMYQHFKGDIKKTAEWCDKAPKDQRSMCFNGLARQIHPITGGSAEKTLSLCSLLPNAEQSGCAIVIANSDYSVGGRKAPFEICSLLKEGQDKCYQSIFGMMRVYISNQTPEELCSPINNWGRKTECLSTLRQ